VEVKRKIRHSEESKLVGDSRQVWKHQKCIRLPTGNLSASLYSSLETSFWQTDPSTELSIHLDKCIKLNGPFVSAEENEPLIPGAWLLLLVSSLICPLTGIHWHLLDMVDGWLICKVLPSTVVFQNSKYTEL